MGKYDAQFNKMREKVIELLQDIERLKKERGDLVSTINEQLRDRQKEMRGLLDDLRVGQVQTRIDDE